jgi:predicted short-subunit dehydrogenase-like oxidoreductase (DUF2520 family)
MATNKRIALIGAGNVATHLGVALQKAGCSIVQVYSRTEASASALANRLEVPFVTSLDEVCTDADVYIVMVKDAVLQDLIPALVKGREEALFVHTAGSMPMGVLENLANRHGVLYPMQTFSKAREVDFSSVSFFVEANGRSDLDILKSMAGALSPKVYEATSSQRTYLHMAAVFACNFANHMYALSARLLEKNGLPFDAMLPLIDETARKVHGLHPKVAQTGPAVRGDENVMGKHLEMLADEPEIKEIYNMISNSIQGK